MPNLALYALAAVPCLLTSACGSKGSVSLSMRIEGPSLQVERSAVGADAMGGFSLVIALGEEAPKATSVALGTFALERAGIDVLSPLSLSGAMFPVTIGVGETKPFALSFLQSPDPSEADALCEGDLFVHGSLTDSESGEQPTSVQSALFSPTCTP